MLNKYSLVQIAWKININNMRSFYEELVENRMHFNGRIPIAGHVMLNRAIPKQAWELSKDKITMESKIGEGAFGEVWKGTLRLFTNNTVPVAIKVYDIHASIIC
ncbi:unnamed protein product [Nippostrongylus brasiliensis]|uniref:PK_Tyr_Ser-Thr domain-containing protein n=1 Tax=Nippostrongylus brasiliensis TaxID=27835 RepID=A0A0N4Y4A9_NIPBR|nr:unnamed protein product [Nippostrongylus brasiliensis]